MGRTSIWAEDEGTIVSGINPYPVQELKYKQQSLYADFVDNHVFDRFQQYLMLSRNYQRLFNIDVQAQMVNSFDELPDTPFFTNRNGRKLLTIEEIKKGSNVNTGPDTLGEWIITKGKVEGRNPGFFITDSRGDKYLIKLDRMKYPEMISSCEVIASKLFHAIGYNVPQYTICYFNTDILRVAEDALFYDSDGFEKQFTLEKALELIEENGFKNNKGLYRSVASKIVPGVPKGYFSFQSNRSKDLLDPVRHEDRREVRGLRVFSSWLNHHDTRRGNTIDMIVEQKDGWYVKHYLIDFGSCLGSHNMRYKYPEAGHVHVIDVMEVLKSWLSLGLYKRPYWQDIEPFSPAVGYFTSDHFRPGKWKQMIPNYAFDKMTKRDAFWAAKIVMTFTDEQIEAAVSTGDLSLQEDREYLTKIIIERRDILGEYWFSQINPLDNFSLKGQKGACIFSFDNLYKKYGFAKLGDIEKYKFSVFNINDEGERVALLSSFESKDEGINIPSNLFERGNTFEIAIKTCGKYKHWRKEVSVIVNEDMQIIGINRDE